jgi:hypothetical protein
MIRRISLALLVAALTFALTACGKSNDGGGGDGEESVHEYIMIFNGVKVPMAEFEFFAREVKAELENDWGMTDIWEGTMFDRSDEAKEYTIDDLQFSLAITAFGASHGITLPPHLYAEVLQEAEYLRELYTDMFGTELLIGDDRLIEILSVNLVIELLYEKFADSGTLDMDEFYEVFDDFIENYKWEYYDIQVSFFITDDYDAAADFVEQVNAGADFYELREQIYEDEEFEDIEVSLVSFANTFGVMGLEDVQPLAYLSVGDISHVIESWNGLFAVLRIISVEIPDTEEIKADWMIQYAEYEGRNYVHQLYEVFYDTLIFEINYEALDAFRFDALG